MARTDNFLKFVKQPKAGAVKEKIKQEKKKEKKERAAAIEEHFARKREERALQRGGQVPTTQGTNPKASFKNSKYKAANPVAKVEGSKPVTPKAANTKVAGPQPSNAKPPYQKVAPVKGLSEKKTAKIAEKTTAARFQENIKTSKAQEPFTKQTEAAATAARPQKNIKTSKADKPVAKQTEAAATEQMPLNKYIAHSGICSRRDAAILVKELKVTVNDVVATDPGTKILPHDVVKVSGTKITPSRNFVYILLNKPKDFITTLDDPQGRRTVLDLVKQATTERVYPVGRLDRNTSGVLLLTNDGELAQKLSHPKHEIKKVYEVKLDRNLTKGDMDKIAEGITLEDGFIAPDVIAYADAKDKSIIGIEIHSGRNRIVRRLFEHLKYDVRALDRVMYAGLTKKNVQRGNWRFLNDKEVRILKYMNQSMVKS